MATSPDKGEEKDIMTTTTPITVPARRNRFNIGTIVGYVLADIIVALGGLIGGIAFFVSGDRADARGDDWNLYSKWSLLVVGIAVVAVACYIGAYFLADADQNLWAIILTAAITIGGIIGVISVQDHVTWATTWHMLVLGLVFVIWLTLLCAITLHALDN